jgi:hypothetical protein
MLDRLFPEATFTATLEMGRKVRQFALTSGRMGRTVTNLSVNVTSHGVPPPVRVGRLVYYMRFLCLPTQDVQPFLSLVVLVREIKSL